MILIRPQMSREEMENLVRFRDLTLGGLKSICRLCGISEDGLKPGPIKQRLLDHFKGKAVEKNGSDVKCGLHTLGTMGG